MTTMRVAKRGNFTILPNAMLNDGRLSFKAKGLLAWLLSKPDDWTVSSEAIAGMFPNGRDSVRTALRELEAAGYLSRTKVRDAQGKFHTESVVHEVSQDGFPAADNPAPDNPSSNTKDCEPRTDDQGSSLRSEQTQRASESARIAKVAKDYWDWHLEENGGSPAQTFSKLIGVVKACLKREYPADEILAAMKLERRALTAAKVIDRIGQTRREVEERPATSAIPGEVVKAMVLARPWFHRFSPSRPSESARQVEAVAKLVKMGYGVGEAMIRLAVGMRAPAYSDPFWLLNVQGVDRFPGPLENYPDAMERAYRNQGWKA